MAARYETGYVQGPIAQPLTEFLHTFIIELNSQQGTNHTLPAPPSRVAQPGDPWVSSTEEPVLYETPCPHYIWEPWVTSYYPERMAPGVQAAFWCFRSQKDGNRCHWGATKRAKGIPMQQRLDLILLRRDGKLVVLHPGTTQRSSAKPVVEDAIAFKR